MSLSRPHTALGATLGIVLLSAPALSQVFTGTGLTSGSGMTFLPAPAVVPAAHWRAGYARVDYLRSGLRGMNIMALGYGLSSNVEGYVRMTGEQLGTISSLTSYGFGLKGTIPAALPVLESAGVWFESSTSDEGRRSTFFPVKAARGGLIASIGSPEFRTLLLAGAGSVDGDGGPLLGAGLQWAPAGALQIGAELLRGYAGETSVHALGDVSVRVLPFVVLAGSAGHVRVAGASSWAASIALCVSTAGVDFRPAAAAKAKEEYKLPSLEDIMKNSSEEKKE